MVHRSPPGPRPGMAPLLGQLDRLVGMRAEHLPDVLDRETYICRHGPFGTATSVMYSAGLSGREPRPTAPRRNMKKRIWLLVAALALLVAACGDGTGSSTHRRHAGDGGDTTAGRCRWRRNHQHRGQRLDRLGAQRRDRQAADRGRARKPGRGRRHRREHHVHRSLRRLVDVVLEVWPSGITPDEQAFLDDGSGGQHR